MHSNDKAGLKTAFAHLRKAGDDEEAEQKLLGRTTAATQNQTAQSSADGVKYLPATYQLPAIQPARSSGAPGGLSPRPLLQQREAERQLSFRCPISLASELQRKAKFNQLEQQEIIKEGLRRVLSELIDAPEGWQA
jgi:hypothetical protein